MTKAHIVLIALISKHRLKEICRYCDVNYKYAHRIAYEQSKPSYDFIVSLSPIVKPHLWFEKADEDFIKLMDPNSQSTETEKSLPDSSKI